MRFLRGSTSINEKLMINHVVLSLNVFGPRNTTRLMGLVMPENDIFAVPKAILIFLKTYDDSFMREDVEPNRIMTDILKHTSNRYNLDHL